MKIPWVASRLRGLKCRYLKWVDFKFTQTRVDSAPAKLLTNYLMNQIHINLNHHKYTCYYVFQSILRSFNPNATYQSFFLFLCVWSHLKKSTHLESDLWRPVLRAHLLFIKIALKQKFVVRKELKVERNWLMNWIWTPNCGTDHV